MTDNTLQAIYYKRGELSILDQLKLPELSIYIPITTVADAWKAIHTMSIRGAPAIAVCGLLSVAIELYNNKGKFESIDEIKKFIREQLNYLVTARPTAVNMADAARTITNYIESIETEKQIKTIDLYIEHVLEYMETFLKKDIEDNLLIGKHGAEMIKSLSNNDPIKKLSILTHCNTGSLATSGFGTALGVIRQLKQNDHLNLAYFTETRPYNQGSRLTAYELIHDDIPHTMICDSMAGLLMRTRAIHAVVVGADRITANGDTANKIGTYQLAVLAKFHNIPFYIAAPTTSIDFTKQNGDEIVIEERPVNEMTTIKGVSIAAQGVQCWNPAFDITPSELITGIITEYGVFKSNELKEKLLSIMSKQPEGTVG
ncbi:unnamed protein product [Didymodactylos carnosus]|uniref:Methylthioribose-1-phosphate isomerase n=2 Tax=Didymodactylos carnosus TaxID=1234261 RepID=A0A8S2E326_9BILA|nr:unnamed protein product [Didymodactylos carnosus]CAF3875842.1 unnamed protein product [Didymodactylos carnosus]